MVNKNIRGVDLMILFPLLIMLTLWLVPAIVFGAQKNPSDSRAVAPSPTIPTPESRVRKAVECGGMELDPRTGAMTRRPNVDLIVSHLEISHDARGTWVRPTIENLCEGRVSEEVHVSIGEVVVTFLGVAPRSTVNLGWWVGIPTTDSVTAIVDYDRRIPEANDGNNRCTRTNTGSCP